MTFLVAEIGVNWDGDLNLAKEMIVNAKNAGCDAVKFQAFDERIVQKHPQKERLLKSSIFCLLIEDFNNLSFCGCFWTILSSNA